MKKRQAIITVIFAIVLIAGLMIIFFYPRYDKSKMYVREYVVGEEGIIGNVNMDKWGDNPAYEIGANKQGYAVFKDPDKAFNQMKKDLAKGLEAIQEEFNLYPINRWNFLKYGNYGWQLTKTEDKEAIEQAWKVTSFMDIYKDSFSSDFQ